MVVKKAAKDKRDRRISRHGAYILEGKNGEGNDLLRECCCNAGNG